MIKNRTIEFKTKYSSESKTSSKKDLSPEYNKNKFTLTGITNTTETNSIKKSSNKKIAKVQSTAFLKSRTKLQSLSEQPQRVSKKIIENDTSLCQYLNFKPIGLENNFPQRYRKVLDESQFSQITASKSQHSQQLQVKKTLIQIKQLPNLQIFFSALTPRSLFFCCKCYRYVFAIEKNLHYPNCENEYDGSELQKRQKEMIAWQKINMIVELSQYTKTKTTQIQRLLQLSKKGKLSQQYDIQTSPNCTYLTFQQIIEAFFYTYQKLLKQIVSTNTSSIFSVKKIFSCVQARNFESNLFQKKFFN